MANLIASYESAKTGFIVDLVIGPRGEEAVFNSTGANSIVNQLYVFYEINEKLTLTLGNFNTFLGYEVISPLGNFNYSTSYMFSYGPFSHTGIKADYQISDDWSFMLSLLNPTDYTEFNPFNQFVAGVQIGFKGQYVNFLNGTGYTQLDFTGGMDLTKRFFLGINATSTTQKDAGGFWGVALYPQLELSNSFVIGTRMELFYETENYTSLFNEESAKNFSVTLTGNFKTGNLTVKPEVRLDSASEAIFMDRDAQASQQLASFMIATVYEF